MELQGKLSRHPGLCKRLIKPQAYFGMTCSVPLQINLSRADIYRVVHRNDTFILDITKFEFHRLPQPEDLKESVSPQKCIPPPAAHIAQKVFGKHSSVSRVRIIEQSLQTSLISSLSLQDRV